MFAAIERHLARLGIFLVTIEILAVSSIVIVRCFLLVAATTAVDEGLDIMKDFLEIVQRSSPRSISSCA